jgi:hypothetical protein
MVKGTILLDPASPAGCALAKERAEVNTQSPEIHHPLDPRA